MVQEKSEKKPIHKKVLKKINLSHRKRSCSFKNLVEEEDICQDYLEDDDVEEELGNDAGSDTPGSEKPAESPNQRQPPPKKKKPRWKRSVRWARKHVRIRKWMVRGFEQFGENLRYATPMAAPTVLANELSRRYDKKHHGGYNPSTRYHYPNF